MNVISLIWRAAQRRPDATALIDAETGASLSFSSFVRRIAIFGHEIARLMPDAPGGRIALLDDASIDYLCADYGGMAAGFVRVPLDHALNAEELAQQLIDAGADVLLFGSRFEKLAATLQKALAQRGLMVRPLSALFVDDAPARPPVMCRDDMLASLNYTGGSTGRPKAVMHTHGSLTACLQNIQMARNAGPGDVFLNVRPTWPIAAIIVLSHLVAGGTVVLGGRFTPAGFADQIERYAVTHTSLVPTQLVRLLRDLAPGDRQIGQLKRLDIGAAAVPIDVLGQARTLFGDAVAILYGLTEAPWSCYRVPADLNVIKPDDLGTHGFVGSPLFTADVVIMGDDAVPLGPDAVGEVCIRGPHVMQGYWGQQDLTASVMSHGWFHTGDLGRMDADGRLFLSGRAKDVIRTGGKTVQPGEVEDVLQKHPAVSEAGVAGIPDAEWGEIVAAGIVIKSGFSISARDLNAFCRDRLSSHKRPKLIRVLEELPRSHYGKIQRAVLRDMIKASMEKSS